MIALDTNLLVYAHIAELPFHEPSRRVLHRLIEGRETWALPWPCVHEFIGVVTRPQLFKQPSSLSVALDAMQGLTQLPHVQMLAEGPGYLEELAKVATAGQSRGANIHDARIAALCLYHGVTELWSADRDFSRFPMIRVVNPLKS